MPVDKVREILKIAQEPVSLETPIGEEEDSHLGDFIPDEGASEPSEAASFTLLKEQLMDVLSTLTPREEKVLKLRFGIEDGRTPDAGGSGQGVQRDPRAYPPDRGQGPEKAASSLPQQKAEGLPELTVPLGCRYRWRSFRAPAQAQ